MRIYIGLIIFIVALTLRVSWNGHNPPQAKVIDSAQAIGSNPTTKKQDLYKHITEIATKIGIRSIGSQRNYENLQQAASYIQETIEAMGYQPNIYAYVATYGAKKYMVKNIEVVVKGSDPSPGYIVVGAHYDTVNCSPGADDNGSAIAALLEIAKHLRGLDKQKIKTTIKLVAFPNEEAPYSLDQKTGNPYGENMGSIVYAKQAKTNNDEIVGMICLESIGYYSDEPGSQRYPWALKWLKWFYGDKGNFLMAVSNYSSRKFLRKFTKLFKQSKDPFPIHAQSLPQFNLTKDIARSDHNSFWLQGYPAFMVTDTANFRNIRYHTMNDTADSINYEALTRVTKNLCLAIEQLALE